MLTLAKTIGLAILKFFIFIIDIFTRYPLQIILVLICIYAFWQKIRYDAITSEYEAYKVSITQAAKLEKIKNDILRKQAEDKKNDLIAEHKQQLLDANLNREREAKKLKGSINEISDSLTIYRDAIKLRNSTANSVTVSEMAENTSGLTEAERNCYAHLTTVIDACRVTDYDYKTLYKLYDKQCIIYGCE